MSKFEPLTPECIWDVLQVPRGMTGDMRLQFLPGIFRKQIWNVGNVLTYFAIGIFRKQKFEMLGMC